MGGFGLPSAAYAGGMRKSRIPFINGELKLDTDEKEDTSHEYVCVVCTCTTGAFGGREKAELPAKREESRSREVLWNRILIENEE